MASGSQVCWLLMELFVYWFYTLKSMDFSLFECQAECVCGGGLLVLLASFVFESVIKHIPR